MLRTLSLLVMLSTAVAAGSIKYSYDAAGRLTKADYGDGRIIVYTYDPAGNLLKREITTTGATAQSTPETSAARKRKTAR